MRFRRAKGRVDACTTMEMKGLGIGLGHGVGPQLCFRHVIFSMLLRSLRGDAKLAVWCSGSEKRCGHHQVSAGI